MAFEHKPNHGSAFKNDKRKKDDPETHSRPNYTGDALIGGVAYFMDAWINVRENGDRYISAKFKAKDQQPQQAAPRQEPREQRYGDDDGEIPF